MRLISIAGLGVLLLACGTAQNDAASGGHGDAGPASPSPRGNTPLPCAVDAVLAGHCRTCHAYPPLYGAPMPLLSYEDLHAPSSSDPSIPVYSRVLARVHDDAKPMPPPPNARLDASALSVLETWVHAGAPADDGASCSPPGGTPDVDSGIGGGGNPPPPPPTCIADTHIRPTTPFTMYLPEQYACYGFDIAPKGKRHVTQIAVHVDNPQIVHHVLLLRSSVPMSGTPMDCNPGPSFGAPMVYAWGPGGPPLVLPEEAGFPQDETTHYMVQVHYNNAANASKPVDGTGFDLCTTDTLRKYDADVVAFGSEAIILPARATSTLTSCYSAPSSFEGRHLFAAFPHMHRLGKSISTSLVPQTGMPTDLGTDAAWDFSNQPWLGIAATVHTGDVIRTQCVWNNTTDLPAFFGQNTTNEMCYSFTAYYPKLDASIGWAGPATGSVPCQ